METANYSLVLLFLCVLAMLMFYLSHKRSRVQSRQYVVGSLPHSKGVTPIANENANEVSLSTSDNNQPNSVREGESGTVVLPPPLEADDGTISDVSDNERRIGLLDTHAHSLTAAINELIGDMVNRGITVFDATKEEHTNSLPQDVIGALVFGAQTKQAGQLRKTIREFYIRKGIDRTEDQIQVSHGPDKAMTQAIQACVRPGSKVVLPMPHGPEYLDLIRKTGAVPLSAPTFREDGYNLRPEVLKELLDTHQVSCLLLCNPSNLTGAVPSREQLMSLATVLRSYPDVIVISDESYDRIVFDDCVHTCFATLPGMEERTITVTEPGKVFGMPGLCIGVSVSPPKIAKSIASLQASIASSESSIAEHAAIATYSEGATFWLQERVRELQRNRDLCVELLKAEPSLPILFNSPQSVHCLILDVSVFYGRRHLYAKGESVLIRDSATLSLELLRAYQVAVVPGVAFGMDDHIRLHLAVSEDVLREVIVRLKKFLGSLTE